LRALDEASAKQKNHEIDAITATSVALYLLNEKRAALAAIETNRKVRVRVTADEALHSGDFEINVSAGAISDEQADADAPAHVADDVAEDLEIEADDADEIEAEDEAAEAPVRTEAESDERPGRRRRGRRGGRRRRTEGEEAAEAAPTEDGAEAVEALPAARESREGGRNSKRRRRGRGRGRRVYEVDGGEWLDFVGADLKHLSPRPEPRGRKRAAPTEAEEAPASAAIEEMPTAEVITHPAVEPDVAAAAPAPAPEPAMAQAEAPPRYDEAALDYEPDQERRDKFLSRFSRWAKKGG
jgi:ribonuclease E